MPPPPPPCGSLVFLKIGFGFLTLLFLGGGGFFCSRDLNLAAPLSKISFIVGFLHGVVVGLVGLSFLAVGLSLPLVEIGLGVVGWGGTITLGVIGLSFVDGIVRGPPPLRVAQVFTHRPA